MADTVGMAVFEVVQAAATALGAVAEVARRERRKRERGGGAGDTRLRRIDERAQRRCLRVKQEGCCLGQAAVLLPCEAHRRLSGFQVQERGLVHDDVAALAKSTHHPLRVVRVGPRDVNQVGPCGREGFFVVRVPAIDRAVPINAAARPFFALRRAVPDDARGPGDDFLQEVGRLIFVRRDALKPLHRRSQLDQVPDPRFHARLHQEVQQAPDAPRHEGGDACLHRLDHRLRPPRHLAGVRFHLDPEDPEVPPVVPAQLVCVALPPRHAAQRARLAVDFGAGADLGEPTEHCLDRLAALVPCQRRRDQRLSEAARGRVGRAAGGQRLATGRYQRDRRDHRAGVHVDGVRLLHQPLDLPERQPVEVVMQRDVLAGLHDDVPVPLPQEEEPLLGLELIHEDAVLAGRQEEVEIPWALAAVHARVVAARRLDRRRQLDQVDVARLHLGLEQKVQHPVEALGQDAEDADLGLVDDRLLEAEGSGEVAPGADPLHPEEVPGFVRQVTRVRLEAPSSQRRERDPFDVAPLLPAPLVQPAASGGDVGKTALRGQGGG